MKGKQFLVSLLSVALILNTSVSALAMEKETLKPDILKADVMEESNENYLEEKEVFQATKEEMQTNALKLNAEMISKGKTAQSLEEIIGELSIPVYEGKNTVSGNDDMLQREKEYKDRTTDFWQVSPDEKWYVT